MSYLFELFSLELSLKRVISGDVRFRSVVSITLSLLDVKKAAGIESTRTVPVDLYRYDTRFALPVYGDDGNIERYNIFRGRLLIRHASSGRKYLYDILEIKKETGKSCQT